MLNPPYGVSPEWGEEKNVEEEWSALVTARTVKVYVLAPDGTLGRTTTFVIT